jgi:hypothetical protein
MNMCVDICRVYPRLSSPRRAHRAGSSASARRRPRAMGQATLGGYIHHSTAHHCIVQITASVASIPPWCRHTATCIIIAPKRLKLRLSGSARKSQKRFRDTPMFKFRAVLARTQPFLSRSVEKRGDQSRFKCRKWSIIMQFAVYEKQLQWHTHWGLCCVVVLLRAAASRAQRWPAMSRGKLYSPNPAAY